MTWRLRAARYVRTIRYLRPAQLWHQVLRRLHPLRFGSVSPAAGVAAPPLGWSGQEPFLPPANAANTRAAMLSGIFTFQSRQEPLGFPPDWNRSGPPLLWRYNLHYHEFIWVLPFERAREVAKDWIAHHPSGPDRVGWEPYPTSLRISTWCTCFFGHHRSRTLGDDAFRNTLWRSIHEQADHLARNVEWHLLGNHLLENAVALVLAGSCFDHPSARAWLRKGRALLAQELPEQILDDGGHIERSPMYQCRVLHALLAVHDTGEQDLGALVRPQLARIAEALAALTHPDGRIALLNDSAFGVYPDPKGLVRNAGAAPPAPGTFALAHSGYYGARTADGHYVVCDAGPVGPDYQPGHGHADLLSFELSLRGVRVVVDSGVGTYEAGAQRDYCRSTRAHNTVEIEGQDQVELWGAFRIGRRCRPHDIVWRVLDGAFELSARHDGYRVLPGRPTHARKFRWQDRGKLEISDRVDAKRPVRSVARLHFHPECRLTGLDGETCIVDFPGGRVRLTWTGWETATEEKSLYCPAFGVAQRNPCLALTTVAAHVRGAIRVELA